MHHRHFHNITHLCLPHQDDISYHQSEGVALTVSSYPTTQTLAFRQSVLNSHTLQFVCHCHHYSLLIPSTVSWWRLSLSSAFITPSPLNSLHPSISCETFCSFHFLPQIYIYLLLTVNFNSSCVVCQVWMMNECPLISVSSSWLHVEQVGASFKQNQLLIVSVKVWKSDVCLDRTPLVCSLPSLIHPKELLIIVSVDWYAINWDHGLVNCGTIILRGCWLFCQNKIQVFCLRALIIIAGNRIRRGDISQFHVIAQH